MSAPEEPTAAAREENLSALFAQLVMQQTNMALMLLGKLANPHTGELMNDPEAAGFFIDQLDMLEAKTRGNLNAEEERLLKQSLMTLRVAFVEVVEKPAAGPAAAAEKTSAPVAPPESGDANQGRKFSKKC